MNGITLLLISVALLVLGYIFYGRYLCKKWGVGELDTETPAHTMEDGIDYVPAKAPVLMGHHFSSIAGAGPITGPISAAAAGFGWGACALWIIIGGIFFGGVHDFGALFASVRHGGKSIGEIISANMSKRAKRLFIIFAYLTLILVVAAFASIVAGTFGATFDASGAVDMVASEANARVAMVSILFIVIAIVFGFCVYRRNVPMGAASVVGVLAIVAIMMLFIRNDKRNKIFKKNFFRKRINTILFTSSFLILTSMTIISVLFVYKRNETNMYDLMSTKINTIQALTESRVRQARTWQDLLSPEISPSTARPLRLRSSLSFFAIFFIKCT